MECYSPMKTKDILPFATTWMNLENTMLSEINQRNTNIAQYHLYVESKRAKLLKTDSRPVVTRVAGWGDLGIYCLRVQTCNYQINKLWRANVQHSDYRQQYCIINFKVSKRADLNCSHHKKEIIM